MKPKHLTLDAEQERVMKQALAEYLEHHRTKRDPARPHDTDIAAELLATLRYGEV